MIETDVLHSLVGVYLSYCMDGQQKPTQKGIAACLGVSQSTISNVVRNSFNGHTYTDRPQINRCINNNDFEFIKLALIEKIEGGTT